jgi:hypothetical protein
MSACFLIQYECLVFVKRESHQQLETFLFFLLLDNIIKKIFPFFFSLKTYFSFTQTCGQRSTSLPKHRHQSHHHSSVATNRLVPLSPLTRVPRHQPDIPRTMWPARACTHVTSAAAHATLSIRCARAPRKAMMILFLARPTASNEVRNGNGVQKDNDNAGQEK